MLMLCGVKLCLVICDLSLNMERNLTLFSLGNIKTGFSLEFCYLENRETVGTSLSKVRSQQKLVM